MPTLEPRSRNAIIDRSRQHLYRLISGPHDLLLKNGAAGAGQVSWRLGVYIVAKDAGTSLVDRHEDAGNHAQGSSCSLADLV